MKKHPVVRLPEVGAWGVGLALALVLALANTLPALAGTAEDLLETGRLAALRGDWGGAAQALNALLAMEPGGPLADDAYFLLGSAYAESGRYAEAARAWRELLSRFPRSALAGQASLRLARVLEEHLRDPRGAEEIYGGLSRMADSSLAAQGEAGLARSREREKDFPAAVAQYDRVQKSAGKGARPGASSSSLGQQAEAKMIFLQENSLRSPQGLSLYTDAESLYGQGRYAEAERTLREILARYPDFPAQDQAMVLLAKALDQQGKRDEGERVLKDAGGKYPGSEALSRYLRERKTLRSLEQMPAPAGYR